MTACRSQKLEGFGGVICKNDDSIMILGLFALNPTMKSLTKTKMTLLAVTLAALVPMVWSAGLIGKGIWQYQQLTAQAEDKGQNSPNFARVPNVASGTFNYGGSTAWASLRLAVDSIIQSERPELKLRYVQPEKSPPGSSPGIEMLLDNKVAFVQSSYPLSPQNHESARQKGLSLKQVPVAVDSVAVAVNPDLDISGLTLKQLEAIYTGKINNWKDVGGRDLKITAYSRPTNTGGMVDLFKAKILRHQEFGSNVKFVSTTTQALRKLSKVPGGIYFGSTPSIVPQCSVKSLPIGRQANKLVAPYQKPVIPNDQCPQKRNKLNFNAIQNAQYPLTHYLYVVFLENQGERSQVGRAYANFLLTPQGQRLITQTGFIPLN